jgi:drug/metabolite transporter (DMT)-like permease
MYLYYKGLKKLSAHNASIAELFFPLSAVVVNWVFLGQALKPMQILGAIILIGASYFMQTTKSSNQTSV